MRYLGEIEAAWATGGSKLHWGIWRVTRVAAAIDEQNQASRRTVESVGFAFDRLATEAEASESGVMLKYVLSHPVRA